MSAEANLISSQALEGVPCPHCGAPGMHDQRYCLECGVRRGEARSRFLDELAPSSGRAPDRVLGGPSPDRARSASGWTTVLAGVGVLLLAMGVGVLIGRSGGGGTATAPPEVVSVSSPGVGQTGAGDTGAASASGSEAAAPAAVFTDSWPAGKDGYTVQLQTLTGGGTQAAEVTSAETAARAKGAKAVGALRSDDYRGLPSGLYVIYSGVYATAAQASRALAGLKKTFPAAKRIHIAAGGGSGSGSAAKGGEGSAGKSDTGAASTPGSTTPSTPAGNGQSNEQKTRSMPDVVSTG